MSKLSEAFELARSLHERQVRKGTSIPYLSHLMSVSALVMEHGGDDPVPPWDWRKSRSTR